MKLFQIASLCSVFAFSAATATAQTLGAWQMHKNKTIIAFDSGTPQKKKDAFDKGVIPAQNAAGWTAPPMAGGKVNVAEESILTTCAKELHFTYFQTVINVPSNVKIENLSVSFDVVDDAARIYLFNSKNPKGVFNEKTDLFHGGAGTSSDLTSLVASGENRIVIVQYDNCATKNNIKGIHVKLNGTEIVPVVAPPKLPAKFKVHAFSISQGSGDKAAYYFALNNNTRGVILSNAKVTGGAKLMEIQQVTISPDVYAFKVLNAGTDMYLNARDNKEVHIDNMPGGKLAESAKFKSVGALTTAKDATENNFHSFQSLKFPNHYLRHENFLLFVHPNNNTELFKQDASWQIQKM